jgi:hypothetical protein
MPCYRSVSLDQGFINSAMYLTYLEDSFKQIVTTDVVHLAMGQRMCVSNKLSRADVATSGLGLRFEETLPTIDVLPFKVKSKCNTSEIGPVTCY